IAPLFDQLEARSPQCTDTQKLEDWILDWGELSAAIDEEGSRRYIAMTCFTEDPALEKAYLDFIEQVEPQVKPRQHKLSELFLAHPLRSKLYQARFAVFDRDTALRVELFRQENIALETEEAKLGQLYQKLCGSLIVEFQGKERTLPQMAPFLEEQDRSLRESAWKLTAERRLREKEQFESQFDGLLALRERMAANAGFKDYRAFAFRMRGRFDYTPEDCERFHGTVESEVMPVLRAMRARRRQQMKLEKLRPWDLAVDANNLPPLRPFTDVTQMVSGSQRIFDRLSQPLAEGFRLMQTQGLLDLGNRKGKAPGGYQSTLSEARLPFIFMNAVGQQRDVETMLHEAGHAFHALATQEEDLYAYRSAPIEFCEVASMSMELLGNEFLEEFYSPADANRARQAHLEGIVQILSWIAAVDAFQHWIYTHPGHARSERTQAWIQVMKRFGDDVDWSGHEEVLANLWHRQLHIFLYPFYYIEYGIAQLGALQVWSNSRQDKTKALADYRRGLGLGGSRPLPELFQAAGCRFDFSQATIRPLVQLVQRELDQLQKAPSRP
ncbi:MAG: M3 family oligoendopeptidase, partial [Verrucomicrobia bacterium]|nr:M3 family oligoendopeptidase [Verrucomicrobiota bacterium]